MTPPGREARRAHRARPSQGRPSPLPQSGGAPAPARLAGRREARRALCRRRGRAGRSGPRRRARTLPRTVAPEGRRSHVPRPRRSPRARSSSSRSRARRRGATRTTDRRPRRGSRSPRRSRVLDRQRRRSYVYRTPGEPTTVWAVTGAGSALGRVALRGANFGVFTVARRASATDDSAMHAAPVPHDLPPEPAARHLRRRSSAGARARGDRPLARPPGSRGPRDRGRSGHREDDALGGGCAPRGRRGRARPRLPPRRDRGARVVRCARRPARAGAPDRRGRRAGATQACARRCAAPPRGLGVEPRRDRRRARGALDAP